MTYKILQDEAKFNDFFAFLPELEANEIYYAALFGRHKYCATMPNLRDNQLVRFTTSKEDLKEKIIRLECPIGGYKRDGIDVPTEAIALYIALNPRNLVKANKALLIELAKRIADGNTTSNPLSLARTAIHNATDRKNFVDFDYDNIEPAQHLPAIKAILPEHAFRILKTRGGFHLLVKLADAPKGKWFKDLAALEGCDVRGGNTMIPVPGCVQGGYIPHLL